jgi:hypothetical protein
LGGWEAFYEQMTRILEHDACFAKPRGFDGTVSEVLEPLIDDLPDFSTQGLQINIGSFYPNLQKDDLRTFFEDTDLSGQAVIASLGMSQEYAATGTKLLNTLCFTDQTPWAEDQSISATAGTLIFARINKK